MKECDKRQSHIRSKLYTIYISSSNIIHPATKTFTALHYISPNYTSFHTLVDTSHSLI